MPTPSIYWREIPQRYRLEANACPKCGLKFFPPRVVCPQCRETKLEPARLAESGKVLTYTIIHVPPQPFSDQAPYAMGIVELEDGVRILAQIVDCDFDKLKVGLRVRVEFRKIRSEGEAGIICYGYKFVPAE